MTDTEMPEDWAGKATEFVEHATSIIRDHSVKPLTGALRAIVIGIIVGFLALVAFVVLIAGVMHLLDDDAFSGHVWVTDFIVGGIFVAAGLFLLRQGTKLRNRHG